MADRKTLFLVAALSHAFVGALLGLGFVAYGINLPASSLAGQIALWLFAAWKVFWFPAPMLSIYLPGLGGLALLWLLSSLGWVTVFCLAWRALRHRRRSHLASKQGNLL